MNEWCSLALISDIRGRYMVLVNDNCRPTTPSNIIHTELATDMEHLRALCTEEYYNFLVSNEGDEYIIQRSKF